LPRAESELLLRSRAVFTGFRKSGGKHDNAFDAARHRIFQRLQRVPGWHGEDGQVHRTAHRAQAGVGGQALYLGLCRVNGVNLSRKFLRNQVAQRDSAGFDAAGRGADNRNG
jgi:hypothetical protein